MLFEKCWCDGVGRRLIKETHSITGIEKTVVDLCPCARSKTVLMNHPVLAPTGNNWLKVWSPEFQKRHNLIVTGSRLDFLMQVKHFLMGRPMEISTKKQGPIFHSIELCTNFYLNEGGSDLLDLLKYDLLILLFDNSQPNKILSDLVLEAVSLRLTEQISSTYSMKPTWIYCPGPLESCQWEYSQKLGELIKNFFLSVSLASSGIQEEESKSKVHAANFTVGG